MEIFEDHIHISGAGVDKEYEDKDLYDSMSNMFMRHNKAANIKISSTTFYKSNLLYFSRVLSMKRNVTSLILENVVLPEEGSYYLGLSIIANQQLAVLSLASTRLSESGLVNLFAVLESSHVEKLTMTGNTFNARVVAAINTMLIRNTTIATLFFNFNEIQDADAAILATGLAAHPALVELHLESNKIGNEGVAFIIEAVVALTSVTTLALVNNTIGCEGAICIAAALNMSPSLRVLDLGGNKIKSEGCIALMEAMCRNVVVQNLRIYNNSIGNDAVPSIVRMLKVNRTLTSFSLAFNNLTTNDINTCCDALEHNGAITDFFTNRTLGTRYRFVKRNQLNAKRKTTTMLDIMIDRCFRWLR